MVETKKLSKTIAEAVFDWIISLQWAVRPEKLAEEFKAGMQDIIEDVIRKGRESEAPKKHDLRIIPKGAELNWDRHHEGGEMLQCLDCGSVFTKRFHQYAEWIDCSDERRFREGNRETALSMMVDVSSERFEP
ncbi:MAG: hypothetical protein GY896_22850 [Gammaproteobacteria bacterium]|nr:hypothetical protein [Gammaproteobacteria bacterium]